VGFGRAMRSSIRVSPTQKTHLGHWIEVVLDFIECFFIDRDYYVQAILDADETVFAFSVTTRSPRFAPR
jgi:hypothetical protein